MEASFVYNGGPPQLGRRMGLSIRCVNYGKNKLPQLHKDNQDFFKIKKKMEEQ